MEDATTTQINVNEIDFTDRTYIFTFEPIMSQMIRSIQNIDLINPPMLAKISDKPSYRIISGLKRILALIHLKITTFPALVYQDVLDKPRLDLFLLNFYENISIRELNPIEKSHVLNKLFSTFKVSQEEILSIYLPLMGLGSNKKVLDLYIPLIRLEDNLKIAVVEDFFSVEIAVRLLNYTHRDRQSIYELFSILKFGKNWQKEFLRLLHDISQLQNKPIYEIINHNLIQSILNNEELTVPLKINKIKDHLRKLRFPIFSQAKEKFNLLKKELKLPPHIKFRSPPFFESDKYSIEIIFRNQTEFESGLKILTKILSDQKLKQLDSIIQ